jgi:4-hydroxy-tetrahydrodipicolinate reductase
MEIALIGYGKMGQAIEALGKRQGHTFPLKIDVQNPNDLNKENVRGVEVAIEFTTPATAPENICRCLELGIPVVSGTTGWNRQFGEVNDCCTKNEGALFYASNFSVGVNILFAMNRKLADIMNRFSGYAPSMREVHHIHKLDAPSGTAISLADQIIGSMDRIRDWSLESSDEPVTMHIEAIREGEVKGIHHVIYESDLDQITLSHEAKSRDAFAAGALMAASFLPGKRGIFNMDDLLNI